MSSTRRADLNAPLSQERFMSSAEFAELRAISGTAVAKRCSLLVSPAKRELLWFIQGMSLGDGGLKRFARELLQMFPERIDHKEFELLRSLDGYPPSPAAVASECEKTALGRVRRDAYSRGPLSIEEFLVDLCINPRVQIRLKQGELETSEFDTERARDKFPELEDIDFHEAGLSYFRDIIGALVEYKRRYEEQVRAEFCLTAIGRQIWKQLDAALETRTMIVLDGLEGRGKTEAVRAWCNCHLGSARFLSLKGTNTKTAHFREFARPLGVGYGINYKVSEMQGRVEEILRTAHLMLVIDEAHFFFNQAPRMKTRPEMLDYIDTALCNPPLPVALVTTPQFMICMERAAGQVGWNYRQFKRRCKRYCRLPAKNTPEDIEAVARHLLPGVDKATIKQVLAYEALSKRDLSAVGDVAREAQLLAKEGGARAVTFEHVKRAIHEVLLVSDVPWAEMEKRLKDKQRGRTARTQALAVEPHSGQEAAGTREREISPRISTGIPRGNRMRFPEAISAPASEPDEAILTPV